MHTTRTTAAAGILAALLLTGCGSDDEPTVTKASPPPATSTTPTPEPTPTEKPLTVGDTANIDAPDAKLAAGVLAYTDQGITGIPEMLSSGQKWAVAEVKLCNKGEEAVGVSTMPWSLAYADGARVESAGLNAGELPQPLYPMEAKIKQGDCVRGNIVFTVPKEGRPERVLYTIEDLDEPVEWTVPKN